VIVMGDGCHLEDALFVKLCLCDKWRAVSCRSSEGKNVHSVCR